MRQEVRRMSESVRESEGGRDTIMSPVAME